MAAAVRRSARRHPVPPARVAALAAAAVYAGLLAATDPFTLPADVLTGLGLAGLLAVAVAQHVGARAGAPRRWDRHPERAAPLSRRALPWVALLLAVVTFELVSLAGARSTHPTLSSIYDAATTWRPVKALAVLLWLGAGWSLVRR